MAAVLAALASAIVLEKRLSPMPLFTAVLVVIFGGLTLYLKNEIFIKMKPTVLYGFFGAVLLGGLAFNRLFIKYVFAQAFELDEAGWRQADLALGHFLSAAGGAERGGVAQCLNRDLGVVQGLGHHPADIPVCAGADAAGDETSASSRKSPRD